MTEQPDARQEQLEADLRNAVCSAANSGLSISEALDGLDTVTTELREFMVEKRKELH